MTSRCDPEAHTAVFLGPTLLRARVHALAVAGDSAQRLTTLRHGLEAVEVYEPDWTEGVDFNVEALKTLVRVALRKSEDGE